MLPIRVKGLGMIPRIGRLAPMLTPHPVDLKTLEVIIDTGGMRAEFVNLDTRPAGVIKLDASNYKEVYEQYATGGRGVIDKKPKPAVKPPSKPPVPVKPVKETPPPLAPQIPFAVIIDENDNKVSTGVTIEQLASGKVKGKADWWIPQGNDLVPIKSEWVEKETTPPVVTPPTPPPIEKDKVDDKAPEDDIIIKPMGVSEPDEKPPVPTNQNFNSNNHGKKNKHK